MKNTDLSRHPRADGQHFESLRGRKLICSSEQRDGAAASFCFAFNCFCGANPESA